MAQSLDGMMNFNQFTGAHFGAAPMLRDDQCPVCSGNVVAVPVSSRRRTLAELMAQVGGELLVAANSRRPYFKPGFRHF
jgi:hypothetical protein